MGKHPTEDRFCGYCGKVFAARLANLKKGKGRFCSRRCAKLRKYRKKLNGGAMFKTNVANAGQLHVQAPVALPSGGEYGVTSENIFKASISPMLLQQPFKLERKVRDLFNKFSYVGGI